MLLVFFHFFTLTLGSSQPRLLKKLTFYVYFLHRELISCFTDQSADVIGDWLEGGRGVLKETAVKCTLLGIFTVCLVQDDICQVEKLLQEV